MEADHSGGISSISHSKQVSAQKDHIVLQFRWQITEAICTLEFSASIYELPYPKKIYICVVPYLSQCEQHPSDEQTLRYMMGVQFHKFLSEWDAVALMTVVPSKSK
jgi:hypothetical protein